MSDWYHDPKYTSGKPIRRSLFWTILAGGIILVKLLFWAWAFTR